MAEFQTGKTDPGESCLKQLESLLRAYAAEEGDAAGQDRRHRQEAAGEAARRRWASAAKPLGSLGLLEQAVEQIAVLTGTEEVDLSGKAVLVFCADNGVVAQGVSQTGCNVTAAAVRQMIRRRTSVSRMADRAGCFVVPVDMGILDFEGGPEMRSFRDPEGILNRRVRNGTADLTEGPAMTREEAARAVLTGIRLAEKAKEEGFRLLAAGEMGIGNTTTSSAVISVLLGLAPEKVTGRGAGLSDEGLLRKLRAIRAGIEKNRPDPGDPLDVLSKVGGLDLAGMCGLFLGGMLYRVPVLMDGLPSSAAALLAVRMCPAASGAVFASHVSAEPAGGIVLGELGKKPLISAEMRLGEGTGSVAAMPLLDMALEVYRSCYTFEEGGIEPYVPQN